MSSIERTSTVGAERSCVVIYALSGPFTAAVRRSLEALTEIARSVVVLRSAGDSDESSGVTTIPGVESIVVAGIASGAYPEGVEHIRSSLLDDDEVVLTGDGWFGPVSDLRLTVEYMRAQRFEHWLMLDPAQAPAFPDEGFAEVVEPWVWTTVRAGVLDSSLWSRFWSKGEGSEEAFARTARESGLRTGTAFPSARSMPNAALVAPDLLMYAGCPIVRRTAFGLYPPYLHQQAFLGREVLRAIGESGYPVGLALEALCRTVPPKALNTNAGMLEIVPSVPQPDPEVDMRIVAVVHVSDLDRAADLLDPLRSLPPGWDLVVTTGDGRKAARLAKVFRPGVEGGPAAVDIRVAPGARGRDMGDFFVACRDVIQSDEYDLIVKVHSRTMRSKPANVRRYFRRYQLDNLLGSADHVRAVLGLFAREPQLGLVFPPMMHIGYATMGRAWQGYRPYALGLASRLGINVPFDVSSPLAPFGGMFFARPAALRRMDIGWQYRDYGKPGRKLYSDLAHLQERMLVPSAAQDGFHSRTVLTSAHAAISHTALEFKVDQLFSTTSGYPVDQIRIMHRAGRTGYGGIVGLGRMYLSLNHPRFAAVALPVLAVAERLYGAFRRMVGDERFALPKDRGDDL